MKKHKLILCSLLIALTSYSKINIEVNTGIKFGVGIDNIEKPLYLLADVLDYMKVHEGSIDKEQTISSTNTKNLDNAENIYVPNDSKAKKITGVVLDTLKDNLHKEKYVNFKLKENKYGFFVNGDFSSKDLLSTNYDKAKIAVGLDNIYLNANVRFQVKGNISDKIGLDKIEDEEKAQEKDVLYTFNVDPFAKKMVRPTLFIDGVNKKANISPRLTASKNNFYFSVGPNFKTFNEEANINKELDRIPYAAPGNKKIEYLKTWELDETISETDLTKAKVNGKNGTDRLVGRPSGSLYGESLLHFLVREGANEINNSDLTAISELIKSIDASNESKLSLIFNALKNNKKIKEEFSNFDNFNVIIDKIAKKTLTKLDVNPDNKYSSYGLYNLIPYNIKDYIPGYSKNSQIISNAGKFNLDYLYYGSTLQEGKQNNEANTSQESKTIKLPRTFVNDFNYKVLPNFLKNNDQIYSAYKAFSNGTPTDKITGFFKILFSTNKIFNDIRTAVTNPNEIKGLEILQGFYLHDSEYEYNKNLLAKKIGGYKKEIPKDLTWHSSLSLAINTGYEKDGLTVNANFDLFNKLSAKGKDFDFTKKYSMANIDLSYAKDKGVRFSTKNYLNFSNVSLKTKTLDFNYNNFDYVTRNYLGYRFVPNQKWFVELGLGHYGQASYIKPITMKDITLDVVDRDKDGKVKFKGEYVNPNTLTEKQLVDEAIKNNKKVPRDTLAFEGLDKKKEGLKASWYNIYNIVAPTFGVGYRPSENIEIYNELKVPIAIKGKQFSGINLAYTGNIKYTLTDNDFNIFNDLSTAYRFRGSVFLGAGYLNSKIRPLYDANISSSLFKASIKGDSLKPEIDLTVNPSILNFPVKPLVGFEKKGDEKALKYGVSMIKDGYTLSIGAKEIKGKKVNVFKDLEDFYKAREGFDDLQIFKNATKNQNFDITLDKIHSPFASLEYEKGAFKIGASISGYRTNHNNTIMQNYGEDLKEEDFKVYDKYISEKASKDYVTWTYLKDRSKVYLYFPQLKVEAHKIVNKSVVYDINKKYFNFSSNLNYGKETGFNVSANLDISYSNIKASITNNKKEMTAKKTNIYGVVMKQWDNWNSVKEQFKEDNRLKFENYEKNQKNYDYLDKFVIEHGGKDKGLDGYWDKDKYRNQLIDEAKKGSEITKSFEDNKTTTTFYHSNTSLKLDPRFGYNHKVNSKLIVGGAITNNFDLHYDKVSAFDAGGKQLNPGSKLTINDTISPELLVKYKFTDKFSLNANTNLDFNIKDKKYNGTNFNIKAGLKYEW